ncbi:hypothetical protein COV93_08100 [Candidatus Woesearchaeota archaeon CG11_big_fil_rev_8_21_14_0_20_43_8]
MKAFKDTPLAEITLRKYEKPNGQSDRELVKKLCLSLGLLQPGDSRDVIVDILLSVIKLKHPSSKAVEDSVISIRRENNLMMNGVASSNIRRQLKRLRDIFILERVGNLYRINEDAPLVEIFEDRIERFLLPSIIGRAKEYMDAVERLREQNI